MNCQFLVHAGSDLYGSYEFIQYHYRLSAIESRNRAGWIFTAGWTMITILVFVTLVLYRSDGYPLRMRTVLSDSAIAVLLLIIWALVVSRRFRYHVMTALIFLFTGIRRFFRPQESIVRQYAFLEDCFSFGGEQMLSWRYPIITDVIDTGKRFLVFMGPGRGIFFKKTDFVVGSPEEFLVFLEKHTDHPVRKVHNYRLF